MGRASGFSWIERKSGEIIIEHDGHVATVLRGRRGEDFLEEVKSGDEQEVMARTQAMEEQRYPLFYGYAEGIVT